MLPSEELKQTNALETHEKEKQSGPGPRDEAAESTEMKSATLSSKA